MTTPKLHPAAERASKVWRRRGVRRGDPLAGYISAAIDDHLKSEGWEELREAMHQLRDVQRHGGVQKVRIACRRVDQALRRVRGEPSAGEEGK